MKYATLLLGLTIVVASVITARAEMLNCGGILIEPGVNAWGLKIETITNLPPSRQGKLVIVWGPTPNNKYGVPVVTLNGKRCEIPE